MKLTVQREGTYGIGAGVAPSAGVKALSPLRLTSWVMLATLAAPTVHAQTTSDNRLRRLVVDASILSPRDPSRARRLIRDASSSSGDSSTSFDIRPIVETVTGTLKAMPHMRAADTTIGIALIGANALSRHPISSVAFVGLQTIRFGLQPQGRSAWRRYDLRPELDRHRFALTIRKTF